MPEGDVRATTIVLTNENAPEFYAKKLDLAPATKDAPAVAADKAEPVKEQPGEKVETKADEKEDEKEVKGNPRIEKRFSELTKQREDAKREAVAAKAEAEAARKEAAELKAKLTPPPKQEDELGEEPKRDQFANDEEYAKARIDYGVEKALSERDKTAKEAQAKAERETLTRSFTERVAKTKTEIPDYEEKIGKATVVVSDQVRDAILESDVGPKILYHFAEHPEEAERIGKLSVMSALRELGKIEAKLSVPAPKTDTVTDGKTATVEVSAAPAPISPLKGNGTAVDTTHVNEKGEFHGTYAQWKAQRKAGKIK